MKKRSHPAKRGQQGQSLIEVLAALAIAVLVILALVHITTISIKNAAFARNQALATKYAQEAMEWLRSQRDSSWTNVLSKATASGTYCLNVLNWSSASSCSSTLSGTLFKRELIFSDVDSTSLNAKISVVWIDDDETHRSELNSTFTKW